MAVDEVGHQVLELGARQRGHEVLGVAVGVDGDVGQVDLGRARGGELDLGALRGLLEALQGLLVLGQVDALVLLELLEQPVDDALVEVVAAEVGVAVGGLDLEDAVAELEDGDVEGAAAEVVDRDLLVGLLVQAVGQRRGGGLVDDALDVEAGDAAGVLGGLALRVVEVGRHGDDGLGDGLAQVGLGVGLELLQRHGADLGRAVGLAVGEGHHDAVAGVVLLDLVGHQVDGALDLGVVPAAADEALDGVDGVGRVGDGLALGDLAHEALALLAEGHHRGHGASALRGGDDGGLAALHDRDGRVGGAEVDTDDASHVCGSL